MKRLRTALIGFGNHSRRTVVPAIASRPEFELVSIVVRDVVRAETAAPHLIRLFRDDHDSAIRDSAIDVVYIATPTGLHSAFVEMALRAGKHVLCEKPLTVRHAETCKLIELADSLGLHLVEVDAYQRHRQFIWLMDELRQRCRAGSRLVSCRANFSIPHRHATDFRYSDALGGGALLDLGYYPLSAMVALLGKPISLSANAYFEPRLRVDLSGATAMHYDGFSAFASWALGAVYDSSIEISLSDCTILARRAFAKPSDFPSEVEVVEQKENQSKSACIAIGEDDQFGKLLSDVWSQIASSDDVSRKDHYAKALGRSWVIDEVSRQIRSGSSRL